MTPELPQKPRASLAREKAMTGRTFSSEGPDECEPVPLLEILPLVRESYVRTLVSHQALPYRWRGAKTEQDVEDIEEIQTREDL